MTDRNDLHSDIAWMRQLAEEGRHAPLAGGSIMMSAGLIYGITSAVHWAIATDRLGTEPSSLSWIWLGATALFMVLIILLRVSGRRGVVSSANRAAGVAWGTVGWGIFALLGCLSIIASRVADPRAIVSVIPCVILIFYGMGWGVSAAMFKSRNLALLGAGSAVAALIVAAMTGDANQYLAYAAALFALMAVPGFLLMQAARRANEARGG